MTVIVAGLSVTALDINAQNTTAKTRLQQEREKWEQQYGFQEDQLTNSFRLEILDSVMFPMVDGEYQQITEEYVHQCIEKKIDE